jgi:haloalkane dehalogenase
MTTEASVEFVRTPDACFENLPDWPYAPQYIEIDGLRQAYVEVGPANAEETILLLHGQPSWSYLYRKMIPVLESAGHRVIAMDHLGLGRSDKPIDPDYYTFQDHVDRLETFMQELDDASLTIFVQDWGSLIGLHVGQGRFPGYQQVSQVVQMLLRLATQQAIAHLAGPTHQIGRRSFRPLGLHLRQQRSVH